MSRFTKVLSDLDARLTVPEPARSRVLLEIAADMEDLHREDRERGFENGEAETAVVEHFGLSDEVLKDLVRVHDTTLQRSLEGLSGQVRGAWSRLLLILLALFVVVTCGSLLFRGQLYRDASALVWILIPILASGLVIAGSQARRLYGGRVAWSPGLRSGLGRLLGLSALIMAVATAGLWVELYLGALRIRNAPGEALIHLVGWVHMASATLVIALSGSLILGFLWFFLEYRARRQELNAAADLLGGVR